MISDSHFFTLKLISFSPYERKPLDSVINAEMFNNLKSSTMTTYPLIFSMQLNESDYQDLQLTMDLLVDCHRQITSTARQNVPFDKFNLMPCILDMNELIRYKKGKGYVWNSYVINLLIIKLKAILYIIQNDPYYGNKVTSTNISLSITELTTILDYHFEKSQGRIG